MYQELQDYDDSAIAEEGRSEVLTAGGTPVNSKEKNKVLPYHIFTRENDQKRFSVFYLVFGKVESQR